MRKQFTALEMDMAEFIRELIKASDERVAQGHTRVTYAEAHYQKAVAIIDRFDEIAKEIASRQN